MSVRPLIPTEPVTAADRQMVGLDGSLNPTNANVKKAGISVALIAGIGILVAIRNPKYVLEIMTATLGLGVGAGYLAMTGPSQNTTSSSGT